MKCFKSELTLECEGMRSPFSNGGGHFNEFLCSFQYKDGEEVVLWVNTVGPYHNRQETYSYFSLPYCQGPKQFISHYHETLGEALQGTELEFSGLEIQFKSEPLSKLLEEL